MTYYGHIARRGFFVAQFITELGCVHGTLRAEPLVVLSILRADLHGTIFVACSNGLRQAHDMIYSCCVRQKTCRSILKHALKRCCNRKSCRRPVVSLSHATKIVPCKLALTLRSPSFWASHSGQTGLGSARIIFDKVKFKIEPSVRKSIWRLGVQSRLGLGLKLSPSNSLRRLKKDLVRFLSRRVKRGSAGRVRPSLTDIDL